MLYWKNHIFDRFMTFFSILYTMKTSLMLADPIFNETHLQSPDFVGDDIDIERKNEKIKFTKLMPLY